MAATMNSTNPTTAMTRTEKASATNMKVDIGIEAVLGETGVDPTRFGYREMEELATNL